MLTSPAAAFADDLAPITTPLPLQRVFLVIAAILLPLDVALRRLRLSPADLVDWLRHPHRVALGLPRWAPELPAQMPAWAPGAWAARRTPPPALRHVPRSEPSFSSNVTPGLARQTETDGAAADDDALGATLRWLAARRGTRGDVG